MAKSARTGCGIDGDVRDFHYLVSRASQDLVDRVSQTYRQHGIGEIF